MKISPAPKVPVGYIQIKASGHAEVYHQESLNSANMVKDAAQVADVAGPFFLSHLYERKRIQSNLKIHPADGLSATDAMWNETSGGPAVFVPVN